MKLALATPETVVFEGAVSTLTAPGELGYFQILPNHAPLLTTLKEGKLTFSTRSGTSHYTITGGFLEFAHNEITLLADSIL